MYVRFHYELRGTNDVLFIYTFMIDHTSAAIYIYGDLLPILLICECAYVARSIFAVQIIRHQLLVYNNINFKLY